MAERGFEARCVEVLSAAAARAHGRLHGRQPRLPRRRRDARGERRRPPRRPDRRRRLRRARRCSRTATRSASTTSPTSAIAPSCAGRRCSARSARCRSPRAAPIGRALRAAQRRREPRDRGALHRRRCRRPRSPWLRAADAPTLVHGHTHAPAQPRSRAGRRAPRPERLGARRQQPAARRGRCAGARRGFARIAPETAPRDRRARRDAAGGAAGAGAHARAPGDSRAALAADARALSVPRRAQRRPGRRSCARWRRSFSREKEFTGARGLVVSDEMAVAIAAQACLPALALGLDWLDGFVGIVVHDDAVVARREVEDDDGIVHAYDEELSGEAMSGGPVMLAWRDVDEAGESAAAGYNVVVHEFAHVIDMRGGVTAGLETVDPESERGRWLNALADEYERLRRPRRRRRGDLPRPVRRRGARGVLRRRRRGVLRRPGRPRARGAAHSTGCSRSSSSRIRRAKR